MTVTELREILKKFEEEGEGEREICVVSSQYCEPISKYFGKWTTDISAYLDEIDGTFTISD